MKIYIGDVFSTRVAGPFMRPVDVCSLWQVCSFRSDKKRGKNGITFAYLQPIADCEGDDYADLAAVPWTILNKQTYIDFSSERATVLVPIEALLDVKRAGDVISRGTCMVCFERGMTDTLVNLCYTHDYNGKRGK